MKYLPAIGFRYIFFELLPVFLLSTFGFVFVILMFQGLRFTELTLIHGVPLMVLGQMLGFMILSFLPVLLPMSLLLSVLITYGRLSSDSEIIAMRALGMSVFKIALPGLFLGFIVMLLSLQTSLNLAPWGNRQFEITLGQVASTKASISLKAETFNEGFYDLVLYAKKVNETTGELEKVFIFDERQSPPLTILAQTGQIQMSEDFRDKSVLLTLKNGEIHKKGQSHTRVSFGDYQIFLQDKSVLKEMGKSLQSETFSDLQNQLTQETDPKRKNGILAEAHKRLAISLACMVFAALGISLSVSSNIRKSGGSSGTVQGIIIILIYWVLFVTMDSMARSSGLPVAFALWLPNVLFLFYAAQRFYKSRFG